MLMQITYSCCCTFFHKHRHIPEIRHQQIYSLPHSLYLWLCPVSAVCSLLYRPALSWRPLSVLSYGGAEALLLSTGVPAHVLQVLQQCHHHRPSAHLQIQPHHFHLAQCYCFSTHQHLQLWLHHHHPTHQSCNHHHFSLYHQSLDHHLSFYFHDSCPSFHPNLTADHRNDHHSSTASHQCSHPPYHLSNYNISQC